MNLHDAAAMLERVPGVEREVFDTEQEARENLSRYGWQDWATVDLEKAFYQCPECGRYFANYDWKHELEDVCRECAPGLLAETNSALKTENWFRGPL